MSRRIVGPINRVEGDLEVQLEIRGHSVAEAWVVSPMYRGFEQMLHGKYPGDAMVYVPRICGICSVSQSVAAAAALADAQGVRMPPNGERAVNLILANENVTDHLTHFYMLFMPDFARDIYSKEPWHADVAARFAAARGSAAAEVLPQRAQFMHLMGVLAGKWPHSLAIQPGGSSRAVRSEEKAKMIATIYQFRKFLEGTLFGSSLESVIELSSNSEPMAWSKQQAGRRSDFATFLDIAEALGLDAMGRGVDRFMSYGVYGVDGKPWLDRGVWSGGVLTPLDCDGIREDVSNSWMQKSEAKHPLHGVTHPDPEMRDGYTWCKAPRLNGEVAEVGALARQAVNGHPLIRDLIGSSGGTVRNRVIARLLEIALVTREMERWVRAIDPNEQFCAIADMPDEAEGIGMMEAARGSLGHWLRIKNGRLLNYQIIAPTTWNFSPRDSLGQPGPLEQALVGAPLRQGEQTPVSVQHIIRSFDPCMVCTVH